LKYNKEETSNSTNTNTINNNIIIKPTRDNLDVEVPNINNSNIKEVDTPKSISEFKEAFIILILCFKNNFVLLNNLIELSDK
jgi:hypothetical protein